MNFEKVVFAFFVLLALSVNFAFFYGEPTDASQHHAYELFAAMIVSLIATLMKVGDRSQVGAVLLATSLVADLMLLSAALVWLVAVQVYALPLEGSVMATVVSLSGGALWANAISVVLLVIETIIARR
jgi:hypothetical protein